MSVQQSLFASASKSDPLVIENLKKQIQANNYKGLQFLLSTIANVDLPQSVIRKSPYLCVELVELMAAAQKEGKISSDLTMKIMQQFFKHKVFSKEGTINESVCIISKDDKEVLFNQTLLNWSLEKAEFIKQTPPYSLDYSAETLGCLKKFLYTNNTSFPSLAHVVDLYDFSYKYNFVELQIFCEKVIRENYNTLTTDAKLLAFTQNVENAELQEELKNELTSKALLTYLKLKNINAHPSNDAHQICLSASHIAMLMNDNPYGNLLKKHVNGFIVSNKEELTAALVFDYLNDAIKTKFTEISFFLKTDQLNDYLKLIFPIFPNLSIYNFKINEEKSRINCLTDLDNLLSPLREVTIRVLNNQKRSEITIFYANKKDECNALINMGPILSNKPIKLLVSKYLDLNPKETTVFSTFQVTPANSEKLFGSKFKCYVLNKKEGV